MEEKVMKDCKVLALCSQKGGVGKTTSCVNLAVGLAKAGKKVLVIDNDPQGSMTASLGYHNPDELPITLATILTKIVEDELFENTLGILHHQEGIDLIPANIELSGMEVSLVNIMSRELVLKGYSQEQCAASMQVARTTVQRIYEIARKKIADALIDGHPLKIEGGDFRICDGQSGNCSFGGCYKQEIYKKYAAEKGEGIMRIAVTYENGQIFQHFGHTETFKIYDVEEGKVVHSEVVDTNGSGHGALAGVLNALNADVLICGGIGGGAQTALAAAGIKLFGGVSGDADEAVEAFINETLEYNPDVKCSHHEHNHGEGHTCGEHGCGSHSCH